MPQPATNATKPTYDGADADATDDPDATLSGSEWAAQHPEASPSAAAAPVEQAAVMLRSAQAAMSLALGSLEAAYAELNKVTAALAQPPPEANRPFRPFATESAGGVLRPMKAARLSAATPGGVVQTAKPTGRQEPPGSKSEAIQAKASAIACWAGKLAFIEYEPDADALLVAGIAGAIIHEASGIIKSAGDASDAAVRNK